MTKKPNFCVYPLDQRTHHMWPKVINKSPVCLRKQEIQRAFNTFLSGYYNIFNHRKLNYISIFYVSGNENQFDISHIPFIYYLNFKKIITCTQTSGSNRRGGRPDSQTTQILLIYIDKLLISLKCYRMSSGYLRQYLTLKRGGNREWIQGEMPGPGTLSPFGLNFP